MSFACRREERVRDAPNCVIWSRLRVACHWRSQGRRPKEAVATRARVRTFARSQLQVRPAAGRHRTLSLPAPAPRERCAMCDEESRAITLYHYILPHRPLRPLRPLPTAGDSSRRSCLSVNCVLQSRLSLVKASVPLALSPLRRSPPPLKLLDCCYLPKPSDLYFSRFFFLASSPRFPSWCHMSRLDLPSQHPVT